MLVYDYSTDYFATPIHTFTPLMSFLMSSIILVAKFGISMNFCVLFGSTTEMFPAQFSVVAFGICQFLARMSTFLAP